MLVWNGRREGDGNTDFGLRLENRFLQLRKLEAAREIAQLVANSNNKLMLDSDSLLLDCEFLISPLLDRRIPRALFELVFPFLFSVTDRETK